MCSHCLHECGDKVFCCKCYKEWYSCDYMEKNDEMDAIDPDYIRDNRDKIHWVQTDENQWKGTFASTVYDCLEDLT